MYIPPPLARTHTRAYPAIFDFCVHLFTNTLQNTVYKWVKGEGFTPFSFTLAFTESFGSLCTMHISCETKRLSSHCAKRGRGLGGKIEKAENEVNKG